MVDSDVAALRGRVSALVDAMKANGAPPDRIVLVLKRLALDSGIHWTNDKSFGQVVDWCLERYFHASSNH